MRTRTGFSTRSTCPSPACHSLGSMLRPNLSPRILARSSSTWLRGILVALSCGADLGGAAEGVALGRG